MFQEITECEFINNSEALVFHNVTNCRVSKTNFKDNSKSSITIEYGCSNMDISAEFENSPNNDFIGISMINNNTISNINITGSSFTGFDLHKRVTYTNIPYLPEYHVIYGVSTETDLRYDVKNNLKRSYIYFSDTKETDKTLINGVLASHNANLDSIAIGGNSIDLIKTLVTGENPNGVNLAKCDSETLEGITIIPEQGNATVAAKVLRGGTTSDIVLDPTGFAPYVFEITDEISVESQSEDTVVTKVYKIKITLNQSFVQDETGLTSALADNCVKQITLEKKITLTNSIDINRNIVLDSSGTNKYTLTLPENTAAVNLKRGCNGIQLNNLHIENEQLNVNIGDKESVSLNNITVAINDSSKVDVSITGVTGDSVFNINGLNTNNLSIIGSGKVILGKYRCSETDIKSTIKEINIYQSAISAILEVSNSEITDLNLGTVVSNVTLKQGTVITNLNINGIDTNLTVDSGVIDNLGITGTATAGQFKTVQINKENTTLTFDDSCTITNLNLNCNNITITCSNDWLSSGKIVIQDGVMVKGTVKINGTPLS